MGLAKDAAGQPGKAASDAVNEASGLGARAADMVDQAGNTAAHLYDQAKERVLDAADSLPGSASDAMAAGHRTYQKGAEAVAQQVSRQPVEALLLAAAIGYLVGWASNRS
jgi:ElaB/YqjD/DUF883 family membrane-anchored ribosome-binding protein